jgi:hypothetical protein
MGWKTIKGRRYYYKSERDGGRVKTTYFGAGESGLLISLLELEDRAEREAEREQRHRGGLAGVRPSFIAGVSRGSDLSRGSRGGHRGGQT